MFKTVSEAFSWNTGKSSSDFKFVAEYLSNIQIEKNKQTQHKTKWQHKILNRWLSYVNFEQLMYVSWEIQSCRWDENCFLHSKLPMYSLAQNLLLRLATKLVTAILNRVRATLDQLNIWGLVSYSNHTKQSYSVVAVYFASHTQQSTLGLVGFGLPD